MKSMNLIEALREARWLDVQRIRRFSVMLLIMSIFGVVGLITTSSNGVDWKGRPLGTDFSNVWSAGTMVLEGQAGDTYNPEKQYAQQQKIFERTDIPFYGWHYPPFFLAVAAALALIPYSLAWLAWMMSTLPLYLWSLWTILPNRLALLAGAAFPAVFVNFSHGQNGFLSAALLGGGLAVLRRNEVVAGVLFGLLAYKPQLGVLIPVALACGGYWKAFASASATVIALLVCSLAVFGMDSWQAFIEFSSFTQSTVLEAGGTGWQKIQSLFSAIRMWGGGLSLAYAGQAAMALTALSVVAYTWRVQAPIELRAVTLLLGSLLTTPYVMDYDLLLLGPAIAFYVSFGLRTGFRPWEKLGLAILWIVPLVTRAVAEHLFVPLALIAIAVLLFAALSRVSSPERGSVPRGRMVAAAN